jgi:tRNA nucleotidyltransferase (CCA-adding enzyme)
MYPACENANYVIIHDICKNQKLYYNDFMKASQIIVKDGLIPKEVAQVISTLENKGFEAYLVGGCARDMLLGRTPKDWDVTTNATPEQIIPLFEKTFYENTFGTVGVVNEAATDESVKIVEVTPYRLESTYSDFRHPDAVKFSTKLEDDLKRRDFTVNAIAISVSDGALKDIIDLYEGFKDIKDKSLKAVGNASDRFSEDALRMIRAARLSTELGFTINVDTKKAILSHSTLLQKVSAERIRDEFSKLLMSAEPKKGIETLHELGLLQHIAPEIEVGIGVEQNQAHAFDVYEHLLRSLQHAADKGWPLDIRLAALFHDIAKPQTRRFSRETNQFTFYGHEVVGSRETLKILNHLKYPKKLVEKVVKMVRWHMFFSDTEEITLSAVRRMITNVGQENIWDLMNLRICDRIGTGRPKEDPYRLRKYKAMVEEALRDPISVAMLKIDGKRLMDVSRVTPGPKIGYTLHALLEEVLEDPKLNTAEYLEKRGLELMAMPEKDLKKLGEAGKDRREEEESKDIEEIQKKYHV